MAKDFGHGFCGSPVGHVRPVSGAEVTELVAKAIATGSKLTLRSG